MNKQELKGKVISKLLTKLGYKNLRGKWDREEVMFDIGVILIAVIFAVTIMNLKG